MGKVNFKFKVRTKKPRKGRDYDPSKEYVVKMASGKWAIRKYRTSTKPTKQTAYQRFLTEFLRYNDEQGIKLGKDWSKECSIVWKSTKAKYGFPIGQSKKAIKNREKATRNLLGAIDYGVIDNDFDEFYKNRKDYIDNKSKTIEKEIDEIEGRVVHGYWNEKEVYNIASQYPTKLVAVVYNSDGQITGLELIKDAEDNEKIYRNYIEVGEDWQEKLGDSGRPINAVEYDSQYDCLVTYLQEDFEGYKEQAKRQKFSISKAMAKLGLKSTKKMTKKEQRERDLQDEITRYENEVKIAEGKNDIKRKIVLYKTLTKLYEKQLNQK